MSQFHTPRGRRRSRKYLDLESASKLDPIDPKVLLSGDPIADPPKGYPILSSLQLRYLKRRLTHDGESVTKSCEAAGSKLSAKTHKSKAVLMYMAGIQKHFTAIAPIASRVERDPADLRRCVVDRLAGIIEGAECMDRDRVNAARALEAYLPPLPTAEDEKIAAFTEDELRDRLRSVLRRVSDHELALAKRVSGVGAGRCSDTPLPHQGNDHVMVLPPAAVIDVDVGASPAAAVTIDAGGGGEEVDGCSGDPQPPKNEDR